VERVSGMTMNNQHTEQRDLLKTCVFCGKTGDVTDDHIPPKNIFPPPRPSNLITVPACQKCNSSTSKDEEYFRLKLCMSQEVGDHPEARKNRDIIFRSLYRKEAKGLKNSFVQDVRKVQLRTSGGLYLGKRYIFDVDLKRIFNVVEKIVRGLYYHEKGYKLDDGCEVDVHSNDTLMDNSPEVLEDIKEKILTPLSSKIPVILGTQTFSYRFQIMDEDPRFSVWLLTFYGNVSFLSLTGPQREEKD
jgi:hypothetical protein